MNFNEFLTSDTGRRLSRHPTPIATPLTLLLRILRHETGRALDAAERRPMTQFTRQLRILWVFELAARILLGHEKVPL